MAYAAVISLRNTIERLVNSSHISILPPSAKITILVFELQFLQRALQKLDSCRSKKKMTALDGQIREAACEFEDVLESHVSNQFLVQSEEDTHPLLFSLDLQELKQDINSFIQMVNKIKKAYIDQLCSPLPEEEDDDVVQSRMDLGGIESNMIGLSDQFMKTKDLLSHNFSPNTWSPSTRTIHSLVGMAGIGKTTLAKKIFQDPLFLSYSRRAFVTIGRNYKLENVLEDILAKVNPEIYEALTEGHEALADLEMMVSKSLKGWRYLIVLDDVWNTGLWNDLNCLLPEDENRSVVLLTTRLQEVAEFFGNPYENRRILLRFLDKEESWNLLREKVFGDEYCPFQLQKAGKKIAENCEGLPLLIITVAKLLSVGEKTPEYWNKVAEKKNSVFMDANDQISEVLFSSYDYLDEHLRPCFLYMGGFPESYKIPHSKLIKLWTVDGFLEPTPPKAVDPVDKLPADLKMAHEFFFGDEYLEQNPFKASEDYAVECLKELVSQSVVVVHERSISGRIKTCKLHTSFWHLCYKEAEKNMFFHILNSYEDGSGEIIERQRRLCIHNNVLFGIKYVFNSIEGNCASTARSLLCFGPFHQYPVPVCLSLRLLRVLDALNIRFYEFPMEVLKLVQLKYLALTYDGNLPAFISKLRNLQCLIVDRYLIIKSSGAPSYLPVEIWDMKELKHLQIMGGNLPDPCGAVLPNLLTLTDVGAHSCTKGVLLGLPHLTKLRIRIELAPDPAEPVNCFDHIFHLHQLETLQYVVVNPRLRSTEVVATPPPLSIFSSCLKKLTLSGFGYPWEDMSRIASLPNLEALKLLHYAFRGPKWETRDKGFLKLEYLIIEDTDLVQWRVKLGSFPKLKSLSIKHCYKLEEIPEELGGQKLGFLIRLNRIQLVDCNPIVVNCAKQLARDYDSMGDGDDLHVNVHSSWDDRQLRSQVI